MSAAPLLFRATLRRDAGLGALGPVLMPRDPDAALAVAHRLVWTLFPDDPDAPRGFLFRQEAPGRFLVLSRRAPEPRALWTLAEAPRPFAPAVEAGTALDFALRCNATRSAHRPDGPGGRGARHDLVMDAIHAVPPKARAGPRAEALGWVEEVQDGTPLPRAPEPVARWMTAQGDRHGFRCDDVAVLGYERRALPRPGRKPGALGILDLEGRLTVTDPAAFLRQAIGIGMPPDAWHPGFGRAKAFGCGLMLLRRPPPRGG